MPEQRESLAEQEHRACLTTLLEQEKAIRSYVSPACHVQHRSALIDYIFEITDDFSLCATTAHIAVKFMDILLSRADAGVDSAKRLPQDRWQLVAMVSLWVAAKLYEVNSPTLGDLYEAAGQFYHPNLIKAFEIDILKRLDWRLLEVVPLQFLDLWNENGLVFQGDLFENKPVIESRVANLSKCLRYFSCVGVQDYESEAFYPSHVAAGMVAASRSALRIEPVWNRKLSVVTGLSADEVFPHYQRLWSVHQQRTSDATQSLSFERFALGALPSPNPKSDSSLLSSLAKEIKSKLRLAGPSQDLIAKKSQCV
eukprot:gb/GEZN01004171.1/.p1 GENE.gb/GEZN01004171.1/~~gb/GEZN01004171.1/.p1  ORF type:complete len:311 (+),score=36.44 gb/GEZN01004171.1/:25-957(+)